MTQTQQIAMKLLGITPIRVGEWVRVSDGLSDETFYEGKVSSVNHIYSETIFIGSWLMSDHFNVIEPPFKGIDKSFSLYRGNQQYEILSFDGRKLEVRFKRIINGHA